MHPEFVSVPEHQPIAQAVLSARRRPDLVTEMGRRARAVAERYSLSSVVQAYRGLLAEVKEGA